MAIAKEFSEQLELVKNCQERIAHENTLCHHRMVWMVIIEGLLFSALGLTTDAGTLLFPTVCVVGAMISWPFWYIQVLGGVARTQIKSQSRSLFKAHGISKTEFPQISGFNHQESALLGWVYPALAPWYVLPAVFFIVWSLLLIHNFWK